MYLQYITVYTIFLLWFVLSSTGYSKLVDRSLFHMSCTKLLVDFLFYFVFVCLQICLSQERPDTITKLQKWLNDCTTLVSLLCSFSVLGLARNRALYKQGGPYFLGQLFLIPSPVCIQLFDLLRVPRAHKPPCSMFHIWGFTSVNLILRSARP